MNPFPTLFDGQFASKTSGTGILLPGMEARILREDGTEADFGEVGDLYLRGPNVAQGYLSNPEATAETFLPGGWLKTGDRFKADKDGWLSCVLLLYGTAR